MAKQRNFDTEDPQILRLPT